MRGGLFCRSIVVEALDGAWGTAIEVVAYYFSRSTLSKVGLVLGLSFGEAGKER
jgi:hypothetical protein